MIMDYIKIKINKKFEGKTIKDFLKSYYLGRGKIEELRNSKRVFLNGVLSSIDSPIKKDDELKIIIEEKIDKTPSYIEADVIYEDEYVLLVNKPSSLLIHDDGNKCEDTLEGRVAAYYLSHRIYRNVRYVHRIDVETSGIVIFAKDFLTSSMLNHMIEEHEIERKYLAICQNRFSAKEGVINAPIASDRHINNKFRVSKNAKNAKRAITNYKVINYVDKKHSLVSLKLETGRTHQIRVHMSYINHPLAGDLLYGGTNELISRVALHSSSVKFLHPITQEYVFVECPLPDDMKKIINLEE